MLSILLLIITINFTIYINNLDVLKYDNLSYVVKKKTISSSNLYIILCKKLKVVDREGNR